MGLPGVGGVNLHDAVVPANSRRHTNFRTATNDRRPKLLYAYEECKRQAKSSRSTKLVLIAINPLIRSTLCREFEVEANVSVVCQPGSLTLRLEEVSIK
jgi:hypothetical protein